MIESNNLLLGTLVNLDASKEVLDNQGKDQLKTDSELKDKDILSSDEDELSPQSFVILMAQVLTVNSDEATATVSANTERTVEVTNALEVSSESATNSTQRQNQSDTQQAALDNETNIINQQQTITAKNIALTWIDSNDFSPPIAGPQDFEAGSYPLINSEMPTFEEFKEKILAAKDIPIKTERDNSNTSTENKLDLTTNNPSKQHASIPTEQFDIAEIEKLVATDAQIKTNPTPTVNYSPVNVDVPSHQATPQQKMVEVPVNINHEQWADKFSEQIIWLGQHSVKSALIKIHPEDLGPLEISIKVVKDAASVNINTHNSYVKEVVDQALPRLREMMAEQGINLSEVNIQSDANSRQYSQRNDESTVVSNQESEQEIQGTTTLNRRPPKGLIDYFA